MHRRPATRCLALATLLAIGACGGGYWIPAAHTWVDKRQVLGAGEPLPERLVLHVYGGSVLVHDGPALTAEVEIEVRAETSQQAKRQVRDVRIAQSRVGDTLELRTVPPPAVQLESVDARYRLVVPATVALEIHTATARVALREYRGDASVATDSGRIHAQLSGGRCHLTTGSGRIELRGRYATADLRTDVGSADVVVPPAGDTPVELAMTSRSGDLEVRLAETDGAELSFSTVDGSLHSELPVDWSREDAPVTDREDRRSDGFVGRAEAIAARIRVDNRNGSLHVRRRADSTSPAPE